MTKAEWTGRIRHFAYAAGWKKFEGLWDFVLRAKLVASMRPVLERVLLGIGRRRAARDVLAPVASEAGLRVLSS